MNRGRRALEGLDQEIRDHLERETQENIDRGMTPRDARRAAILKFGNVALVKEDTRAVWAVAWLERLLKDLRFGIRTLRKRLGFTVVAVLSLAIGIGANTAIFSLVNALILREVPLDRPEELVDIYWDEPTWGLLPTSHPNFEDLRDGTDHVFSTIAGFTLAPVQIDRAQGVGVGWAQAVTGNYFSMLGVEAMLGRAIGPQDDVALGGHPVVMLSHGYWLSRFGGALDVVGSELRIGGQAYTVVGVAPADYRGGARGFEPLLYAPITMTTELTGSDALLTIRSMSMFWAKARLAPGVTRPQAESAVAAVATSLDTVRPEGWNVGDTFRLVPTAEVRVHPAVDRYVRAAGGLLMGVVGLVLLLACTNLAGFLLARARDRRREVALRLALGASRTALVRQLLTETMLLGVLGGAAGLGLAVWLLHVLLNADLPLPVPIPLYLDLGLDWNVLAFTLGLSVLAGLAFGCVPALQSTRPDVVATLKQDTPGGGQPGQVWWRNALVVTQLSVSLVLLVGAGLFLRGYQQRLAVDPGFGRDPTALMTVGNTRGEEVRRLRDRFRLLPGVEAVGLTTFVPLQLGGSGPIAFNVDGHEPPPDREAFQAQAAIVDTGFFDAAGIPIVRGAGFTEAELSERQGVTIASEAMARRFWPDGDALGRLVRRPGTDDPDLRVIGVAADVKVRTLGEPPAMMIYLPYAGGDLRYFTFIARTSADPEQTALALVSAGRAIDLELKIYETKTMAQVLAFSRLAAQLGAFLMSAFAVLALALAVIGLYGVVSYAVASRTREVGIRMALGASSSAIARLLAGNGARLVLIGSGIGLALSLVLGQLVSSQVFGVRAFDPMTFVGAPLILFATAAFATYLPARRASRANPVTALRAE